MRTSPATGEQVRAWPRVSELRSSGNSSPEPLQRRFCWLGLLGALSLSFPGCESQALETNTSAITSGDGTAPDVEEPPSTPLTDDASAGMTTTASPTPVPEESTPANPTPVGSTPASPPIESPDQISPTPVNQNDANTADPTPVGSDVDGGANDSAASDTTGGSDASSPDAAAGEASDGTTNGENGEYTTSDVHPSSSGMPDEEPVAVTGVLVIGAGPAGLAAALEVQDADVPLLVIDQSTEAGGTVRWASRSPTLMLAGTPEQAAAGVVDSADQLLADWPMFTGAAVTPWIEAWATHGVADVHDWLEHLGFDLQLMTTEFADSGDVLRLHDANTSGEAFVDALIAQLDPTVLCLGARATSLVTDGGKVIGARIEDVASGAPGWIQADAVVMATGGFLRNSDQVVWARPDLSGVDLWYSTGPGSEGLGMSMLIDLGADVAHPDVIGLYAHGVDDYRRPGDHEELVVNQLERTMWVNEDAERFVDESQYRSFYGGDAVVAQPGSTAWATFDSDVFPGISLSDPMVEPDDPSDTPSREDAFRSSPDFVEAGTIEDLAEAIGIDPDVFALTVDSYGAQGQQDAMGKDTGLVDPLDHGPFYAIRVVPALAKAFGGITVDLDGAVIDTAGNRIDGVFAAGELTGMAGGSLVGDTGFSGSMSAVLYSGRVAGRGAAAGW